MPGEAGQVAEETTDSSIVPQARMDEKRPDKLLATLKAQLAMKGHAVHERAGGGFLVVATRWGGLSRECADLEALAAFTRRLGIYS